MADDRQRLSVMAALTRMFIVYPSSQMSEEAAQVRLRTYVDILKDLDAEAIITCIEAWIRGDVPNKEARRYPATPAALRDLAKAYPSGRQHEAMILRRLLDATVVPRPANDEHSRAERSRFAEQMRKEFSGEVAAPPRSRKAVDL